MFKAKVAFTENSFPAFFLKVIHLRCDTAQTASPAFQRAQRFFQIEIVEMAVNISIWSPFPCFAPKYVGFVGWTSWNSSFEFGVKTCENYWSMRKRHEGSSRMITLPEYINYCDWRRMRQLRRQVSPNSKSKILATKNYPKIDLHALTPIFFVFMVIEIQRAQHFAK